MGRIKSSSDFELHFRAFAKIPQKHVNGNPFFFILIQQFWFLLSIHEKTKNLLELIHTLWPVKFVNKLLFATHFNPFLF
jgi:hypothetical protein